MEKVKEKRTAWRELFKEFFSGIEQKDEETEGYKNWALENSDEIKKTEGSIKRLEKMLGHADKKEKAKKARSNNNIKSTGIQYEKKNEKPKTKQYEEREI